MATASPSRTRKTAPRKPVGPAPDQDFEPIELTTQDDTAEEVMIHLFSIDGVQYHVPGTTNVALALRLLRKIKEEGEALAQLWLLETMLTEEGFEALMAMDRIKPESLAKVVLAIQKIVLGGLEVPKA